MTRQYAKPAYAVINSDYSIEKGIPIPPKQQKRNFSKYPFHEMDVGDSFAASLYEQQRIRVQAAGHKPKKFTSRKINEVQLRVWRTK